jgi:cytoskeletal protein RodZ
MSERFQSESSGAADFLGLNEELAHSQTGSSPIAHPLPEDWDFPEPSATAQIESEREEFGGEQAPDPGALEPEAAETQTELEAEPAAPASRTSWALVGLASLILAGGALLMIPMGGPSEPQAPTTPPVAVQDQPATKPASTDQPPKQPLAQPEPAPLAQSTPVAEPIPTAESDSTPPVGGENTPDIALDASADAGATSETAAVPEPGEEPQSVVVVPPSAPAQTMEPVLQLGPGVRRAVPADYAKVYFDEALPSGEIQSALRRTTPSVGSVRAELNSGEVYLGRLHSVGMGSIWIDLELGRMRVDARDLKAFEKLVSTTKGSRLEQSVAGLPRVRVRTPGGSIDGWLVARQNDRVTLVTEAAQRLVLESRDVEELGGGRTRIVSRTQP